MLPAKSSRFGNMEEEGGDTLRFSNDATMRDTGGGEHRAFSSSHVLLSYIER
jgi:hypothetical protein